MNLFPTDYIPDPNSGRPLANAKIYVGNAGTDPTIPANQVQLTSRQSDGTAVNLAQPVRTNAGGVPIQANGSPAIIQLPTNLETFAIRVDNVNDVQQYLFSNVSAGTVTSGLDPLAISTTNFNTLTETNFYTGTGAVTGAPPDVPDANLVNCIHIQRSTGNSTQIFFVIDPSSPNLIYNSVYFRTQQGNVFGLHVRVIGDNFLADDINSTSTDIAASLAAVNTLRLASLLKDDVYRGDIPAGSSGATFSDSGWSVSSGGTGIYHIDTNVPFTTGNNNIANWSFSANAKINAPRTITSNNSVTNSSGNVRFTINVYDESGTATNSGFSFILMRISNS